MKIANIERKFFITPKRIEEFQWNLFTLKALFVLKIFKFLSWLIGHVEKRLDKKDKVSFKIYGVTTLLAKNFNTHTARSWKIKTENMLKKFSYISFYV